MSDVGFNFFPPHICHFVFGFVCHRPPVQDSFSCPDDGFCMQFTPEEIANLPVFSLTLYGDLTIEMTPVQYLEQGRRGFFAPRCFFEWPPPTLYQKCCQRFVYRKIVNFVEYRFMSKSPFRISFIRLLTRISFIRRSSSSYEYQVTVEMPPMPYLEHGRTQVLGRFCNFVLATASIPGEKLRPIFEFKLEQAPVFISCPPPTKIHLYVSFTTRQILNRRSK